MTILQQGNVTVTIPDTITIPAEAGNLSIAEMRRLTKARRELGFVCQMTADALQKNPQRLAVPTISVEQLTEKGHQAELIDTLITDLEAILVVLKQANVLLDHEAHEALRRVLAFVRSQEKFDPHLGDLVPHLIAYFSHAKSEGKDPTPAP